MTDSGPSRHLFADVLARVHAVCCRARRRRRAAGGHSICRGSWSSRRATPSHGDMATNAAMVLAKDAKTKPRDLAERSPRNCAPTRLIDKAEVAGPGFINLTLKPQVWSDALAHRAARGRRLRPQRDRRGEKVNVEYVSANPTGPMHVGHCRGAVFGDALASLLSFAGYDVTREYYINDAGAQVDVLARSAFLRYREALGRRHRRDPGRALSRRLSEAGRAGACRRARRQAAERAGSANGCRSCAPTPSP